MKDYFIIPEKAFAELPKQQLIMLGIVTRFYLAKLKFQGSDAWLVDRFAKLGVPIDKTVINRAIRRLKEKGYLTKTREDGRRTLHVVPGRAFTGRQEDGL